MGNKKVISPPSPSREPTKIDNSEWEVSAKRCIKGEGTGKEFVANLQNTSNGNGDKWVDPVCAETWINAKFRTPTFEKAFAIKSANDFKDRDPARIDVLVKYENKGDFVKIDSITDIVFTKRFETLVFPISLENEITELRLNIVANRAFVEKGYWCSFTQLHELILFN